MKMLNIAMVLGLAGVGFGLSAAVAQEALSPDQVRSRILDTCMVSLAREVSQTQATYPACQCYSNGLVKIMDGKDFGAYSKTQQVPARLTPQAKELYAQCRAASKI